MSAALAHPDAFDDSAVELSSGPTTPDGSPLFPSADTPSIAAQLSTLSDGSFSESASESQNACDACDSALAGTVVPLRHGAAQVRNICFMGAGYVGGPTAAVIAFQNPAIRVTVLDRDAGRIQQWKSKHLPIYEPGLDSIVRIGRDGSKTCSIPLKGTVRKCWDTKFENCTVQVPSRLPNLFFSTDAAKNLAEADIVFIGVNTPTKGFGRGAGYATDMTAVEGVSREIAIHVKPGAILVEKSTVPCKTAQMIRDILQKQRPGVPFEILSNPEFLAEGTAIEDLLTPDRIIIGSDKTPAGRQAASTLADVYASWVPRSRIVTINIWSSELAKLVANAMLAQRISSINSISAICERTGADIDEIAKSIGLDARIGPQFLKAGLGFGGSCFRKDILSLVYLAESLNLPEVAEYWKQVVTVNVYQRSRYVDRVISRLNNTLVGKKISIFGFAFKKNTGDTRESLAIDVISTLLEDHPAEIAIYDPCCNVAGISREIETLNNNTGARHLAPFGPVKIYTEPYEAAKDTNAILLLTDWDEFRNTPPVSSKSKPFKKHEAAREPKAAQRDPRPFAGRVPTETELLRLHNYLVSSSAGQDSAELSAVNRYLPQPDCAYPCAACTRELEASFRTGEQLEWARVAYNMREPKWIFDARGILRVPELEKLGCQVESIGRQ